MVIESASRAALPEAGECTRRVTPTSSFKVPLAAIGYEEGVSGDVDPLRRPRGLPEGRGGYRKAPAHGRPAAFGQ